jgi:hypothetical protein
VDAGKVEVEHACDEGFGAGLEAGWGAGEEPGEVVVLDGFFLGIRQYTLAADDLGFDHLGEASCVELVGYGDDWCKEYSKPGR